MSDQLPPLLLYLPTDFLDLCCLIFSFATLIGRYIYVGGTCKRRRLIFPRLVHVLVTSRLDSCNALLYGLPDYLIQRLQYVLNAAAKVITCERTFDHVTPLLIELHWLPVRQRIVFTISVIVHP